MLLGSVLFLDQQYRAIGLATGERQRAEG